MGRGCTILGGSQMPTLVTTAQGQVHSKVLTICWTRSTSIDQGGNDETCGCGPTSLCLSDHFCLQRFTTLVPFTTASSAGRTCDAA